MSLSILAHHTSLFIWIICHEIPSHFLWIRMEAGSSLVSCFKGKTLIKALFPLTIDDNNINDKSGRSSSSGSSIRSSSKQGYSSNISRGSRRSSSGGSSSTSGGTQRPGYSTVSFSLNDHIVLTAGVGGVATPPPGAATDTMLATARSLKTFKQYLLERLICCNQTSMESSLINVNRQDTKNRL